MVSILRRLKRVQKATDIFFECSKSMQFGGKGDKTCFKLGVYIPHWPSTAVEMQMRRALLSDSIRPELVNLSVTDRCPYRCPHCSNARSSNKPMPQSRLVEVVREIQDMGGAWLNIGGGEPGIVFERSLAVVAAAGSRSETWLNTTGFDLNDDRAKQLSEAGLFGGRVSIHSCRAVEHDTFVGYSGAFRIAAEAVQTFRRADIFPIISAAMSEEQITWDKVHGLLQLGKDLGAGFVEIIPIRPAGRAVNTCSHSELKRHSGNRQMFKTFNNDLRFASCPGVDATAYSETPDRFGCVAGSQRMHISASGDVQPCPLVNLSLGNVLETSLASIYQHMRSLVPGPRNNALCYQLRPKVSKYIAGGGFDGLPIPPETSSEILAELAVSGTPKAWVL